MVKDRWPMVKYEDGLFYANCGASLLYFKYTNNLLIMCQPFHKNDSTYLWGPKERDPSMVHMFSARDADYVLSLASSFFHNSAVEFPTKYTLQFVDACTLEWSYDGSNRIYNSIKKRYVGGDTLKCPARIVVSDSLRKRP